jgi:hypothetical protein
LAPGAYSVNYDLIEKKYPTCKFSKSTLPRDKKVLRSDFIVYDKGRAYDAAYKKSCANVNIAAYSVRPDRRKRITRKIDVVKEYIENTKKRRDKARKRDLYMSA